jgi:hypothetical protein
MQTSKIIALIGALLLGMLGASALPGRAAQAVSSPRCHTGRLFIAPVANSGQAGVGHNGLTFRIKSLTQQTCYMEGYPGMLLVDANAHDIATHVQWGNGYLFGNPARQQVMLKTGQSAYFGLEWVINPTPGQSCPNARYLLVTPPDETTTVVVAASLRQICGGKVTTTPILAKAP